MGNDIDNQITIYATSKNDMTEIYDWFLATYQRVDEYNEYGVFKLKDKYDMNMTFNILTKNGPFYLELQTLYKKYDKKLWIKCDWCDLDSCAGLGIFFISEYNNQEFRWNEPAEGYARGGYPEHNHLQTFNERYTS